MLLDSLKNLLGGKKDEEEEEEESTSETEEELQKKHRRGHGPGGPHGDRPRPPEWNGKESSGTEDFKGSDRPKPPEWGIEGEDGSEGGIGRRHSRFDDVAGDRDPRRRPKKNKFEDVGSDEHTD
jgi:hypothetical protein